VFWFTFDEGTLTALSPFCALDTALASRVVLFPELSGGSRVGALAAVALELKVDVAVNGHRLFRNEQSAPDANRTRMLLGCGVVRRDQQSLWVVEERHIAARRGACFDKLTLRCTLGPSIRQHSRSTGATRTNTDLLAFAEPSIREETRLGWKRGDFGKWI